MDGAIAAAAVLAVVYPHNCSVGGDLIALVRTAGQPPRAVFGVGRSAAAIDSGALRRVYGEHVPSFGPYSISVPGVVSGWQAMHEIGGRLPLGQLLEPAVALASEGAAVSSSLARALDALESDDPGLAGIFGPRGRRLGIGEMFVQPRLAETLAQVAAEPESYYRGELAGRLVQGLQSAGSPISLEDFGRHQAVVTDARTAEAGPLAARVHTAGLPSQGVFFASLATMVGELLARSYDLGGGDAALLGRAFYEVSKVRDELLCDPARSPGEDSIRARLDAVDLFASGPPGGRVHRAGGEQAITASGDTVAVVSFDGEGNAVSMLQSIFHGFGSRILDPGTGVLFHNRQSMFTLRPGAPGELQPCLMPPHTLCPSMVDAADGTVSLVLASMGGRAQPQVLTQVLLQMAGGSSADAAVAAPRFVVGNTETPDGHAAVTAERGLPDSVTASLAKGGFDVRTLPGRTEEAGHAQLLRIGGTGVVDAASDPRADGAAARAR